MASLMAMSGAPAAHEQAPSSLGLGHLHLHVGDLEDALGSWRDFIGFEVMTRFPAPPSSGRRLPPPPRG